MQHRLTTKDDFDCVYRVYMAESSNKHLTYDPMDRGAFASIYEDLLSSRTLYVAEEEGRLIGTYRLIPKQYRQAHTVYLGSFGIDPDLKGKGYGFAVLEGIKDAVRASGRSRIELSVDLENDAALRLYKKAGFEIEGTIRNSYKLSTTGRFYDEYAMAILL